MAGVHTPAYFFRRFKIRTLLTSFLLLLTVCLPAVACEDSTLTSQAITLRNELESLKDTLLVETAKLEARRDLRVEDTDAGIASQETKLADTKAKYEERITKKEASIIKAKESLTYAESRVIYYQDQLNTCLATPDKDCTKKQTALDKANARIEKAKARLAKYEADLAQLPLDRDEAIAKIETKIAELQTKRQGYLDTYNAQIDQATSTYNTLIAAKEVEVEALNQTMVSSCGNAGVGKGSK